MNSRQTIKLFSVVLIALSAAFVAFIGWPRAAMTQQTSQKSQATPTIDEYQPKSTLVIKEHKIERAKFPFIDITAITGIPRGGGGPTRQRDGYD